MKIAIDARGAVWFRGTGIGTYTYQLVKNLIRLNNRHEYLVFCPEDSRDLIEYRPGITWQKVPENPDWFAEQAYMMQIMRQAGMDVYHLPQNGLNLPKYVHQPVVVTLHDVIPYLLPQTCNPSFRRRFLAQMPGIVERASLLITVSHYSKRDIVRVLGVPPEKVVVIYAAPEPIYVPLPQEVSREYLARKYHTGPTPFILYIGGFSPRKNVGSLLQAFARCQKDLPSGMMLVLVGKRTPEVETLLQLARVLGINDKVIYPGYVPVGDLPHFYSAAAIFVYPSIYEGFGMPPLEAMACATPTIVSNTASLPEVVGDGALQVSPYDVKELAGAIVQVTQDSRLADRLRRKGKERACQFSWQQAAMETVLVYQAAVART